MKRQQILQLVIAVLLVISVSVGCGAPSTAAPTSVPPAAIPSTPAPTSGPPTATRADAGQQIGEEQYEAVTVADYEPNMEISGRIEWDKDGLVTGGPIDSFSFWGQELELTSNMITDGFLSTKDYGKIMIKVNPDSSMHIELTPSQQIKIKQLKK